MDIPRYDQRVQESDATVRSDVEHVRVKEFEDRDAHLLITSTALSSDDPEPVFTVQLFPGQCLDNIQELLGDQAFKLAKRFFLENRAYRASFLPFTFTEKKLSNLFEQRHRRTLYKEVRELLLGKCKREKRGPVRAIFEKEPFGELE